MSLKLVLLRIFGIDMLDLINKYLLDGEWFWDESQKSNFRELYYDLFQESFGQSARCWDKAINKVSKQIEINSKFV